MEERILQVWFELSKNTYNPRLNLNIFFVLSVISIFYTLTFFYSFYMRQKKVACCFVMASKQYPVLCIVLGKHFLPNLCETKSCPALYRGGWKRPSPCAQPTRGPQTRHRSARAQFGIWGFNSYSEKWLKLCRTDGLLSENAVNTGNRG